MKPTPGGLTKSAAAAGLGVSIQSSFLQALAHHQAGDLHLADGLYRQILLEMPHHADALHLRGVIALQRGDLQVAVDRIRQAIAVRPADNYHCNLGNAFKAQGRRLDAIASYRQALALNGNLAEALSNLGQALLEEGDVGAAVACCERAVALQPGFAMAQLNLGNALQRQGRFNAATGAYRQALRISPAMALASSHLGDTLCAQGLPAEALAAYQQALAAGHDPSELLCKMSVVLLQLGRVDSAIDSAVQALRLSDRANVRHAFVQTVKAAHFQAPRPAVHALLLRALDEGWADPGELLTPSTSLVACDPALQRGIAVATSPWPGHATRAPLLDAAVLHAMAGNQLLMRLLRCDTLNSIALERLLTQARRQMLAAAVDDAQSDAAFPDTVDLLHSAIACQCFINEYVYACSQDECQQAACLRTSLDTCAAEGLQPRARCLVAMAAYVPLSQLHGAEAWAVLDWPAPLAALFTQQLHEPAIERRLRTAIAQLTAIDDPVSLQVRAQYEDHPYPRWVVMPAAAASVDLGTLLRHQCPYAPLQPLANDGTPDVLVAGCGTGQHPIRTAQHIKNARVLAVDLSLASLAYARRKTDALGLAHVDYMQADILRLGAVGRSFDLIESAGVLHHMADPLAGWRVLHSLLRPGGLMYLGLYSALGRRDVVEARQRFAATGLPADASDIRRCRQEIMADDVAPQFAQFLSSRDFYATSSCRDLLFHVQEHRLTLPQLQDVIAQLGLVFLGFALDADALSAYTRQFPDDPARTDLNHWHAFETARPDTFARMYQFWVQKPR